MIFRIDDLTVYFPYDYIYPEQYNYMVELKKAIDSKGHAVVECPSGTGKTVTLLSLIVSYRIQYPNDVAKLVYCSRTIPEIEKIMGELKNLIKYLEKNNHPKANKVMGVVLSSRKNLCINKEVNEITLFFLSKLTFLNFKVAQLKDGRMVDSKCHSLTAGSVMARHETDDSIPICSYYEKFVKLGRKAPSIPNGVYSLDDIKEVGRQSGVCPYYMARQLIAAADVVAYSYHYLIDPKIAEIVSKDLPRKCVVVFDEAHNIDNVCIESMSISLRKSAVESCCDNLDRIKQRLSHMESTEKERLQSEYQRLVKGLRKSKQVNQSADEEQLVSNPVLPDDIAEEAVPGSIRKAEHFIHFMKRFAEFLKTRLRIQHVTLESPAMFLKDIQSKVCIERRPLRFAHDRLTSLVETLEMTDDVHNLYGLMKVAAFATLVSTYTKGFIIIIEPFDDYTPTLPNPIIHLACLDASIAIKPVFERFQTVVVTSGTLSPIDMYPKMLGFRPVVMVSLSMSLARQCLLPIVVSKGSDQVAITSKFDARDDLAVVRNYGNLLVELASVVPDGMVAFFTSYHYLESVIGVWYEQKVIDQLLKHKLVFIETPDSVETSLALRNYQMACENGRGALLLSVARGKVSEGVDFDFHYGRCVVMLGVPYVYTQSRLLRARLDFLRQECCIREADFLTFDAVRQAAQCIGRALRGKSDYGVMVLADKRYSRADKRSRLPNWIQTSLTDAVSDLSTDEAVHLVRKFFRLMAQPFTKEDQLGISLLDANQLASYAAGRRMNMFNNQLDESFMET